MSEWSSYALSDFLMFTPAIYFRQYELVNAALWPLQIVLPLAAVAATGFRFAPVRNAVGWSCLLLMPAWAVSGWWFLHRHYAAINLAADPFALLFALQLLLLLIAALRVRVRERPPMPAKSLLPGLALLTYALLVHPLLGPLTGRSWSSVEVFGVAPDPTALATLGLVLTLRPPLAIWLALIPLAWIVFSGLTYLAMELAVGLVAPVLAILAVVLCAARGRFARGTAI